MVLEGFEKFTHTGRSFKPKISIRSNGQIGFNQGSVKRFGLDKFDFAVMYYNKDQKKVAIAFANDENKDGVIRVTKRENNYFFSGKSFLEYYNIPYKATKTYEVDWDDENKIAIINIGEKKKDKTEQNSEDDD